MLEPLELPNVLQLRYCFVCGSRNLIRRVRPGSDWVCCEDCGGKLARYLSTLPK